MLTVCLHSAYMCFECLKRKVQCLDHAHSIKVKTILIYLEIMYLNLNVYSVHREAKEGCHAHSNAHTNTLNFVRHS